VGQTKLVLAAAASFLLISCTTESPEAVLRATLASQTVGMIRLPPGDLVISEPLRVSASARDLEIQGDGGSRIVAADDFKGAALVIIEGAIGVVLSDFSIDGNRGKLAKPFEMAPPENAFRNWYATNGILADQVEGLRMERLSITNVVHFAVLVSRSSGVRLQEIQVANSGALNAKGRNNLSGGILLEEGTTDFEVKKSTFSKIRGNGLWTHSLLTSPQLSGGAFIENTFDSIGRDAIQVGHAKHVNVERNTGREIGYPFDIVDVENGGTPVAIDTSGDVEGSQYIGNHFDEVNGKCIDLDGFHDGAVTSNSCTNRHSAEDYPHGHFGIVMNNTNAATHSANIDLTGNLIDGAKYGGLFVIGSGNHIVSNRFENLNLSHCNAGSHDCIYKPDEPEILESGIYIGSGGERKEEAKGNVIRNNTVTGYKMAKHCISLAPQIANSANTIENNVCRDVQ
jgi:hypothetical protein